MGNYKTIELSTGKVVNIDYDENPQSPRDLDYTDCNLTKMVCFHSRYNLGDNHNYDKTDVLSWKELERLIQREEDVCVMDPLYMYDHSGQTISTSPFSCSWDSGQVGFVYITKEDIRKTYNVKRISKKTKQLAWKALANEVKIYDDYIRGSVYWFSVGDEEENQLDSCCGFYGDDFIVNGMFDTVCESLTEEECNELKTKIND